MTDDLIAGKMNKKLLIHPYHISKYTLNVINSIQRTSNDQTEAAIKRMNNQNEKNKQKFKENK